MGYQSIDANTAKKLAGLQTDTLQKYRSDNITLTHLEWFNNLSKSQRDELAEWRFDFFKDKPVLAPFSTFTLESVSEHKFNECFQGDSHRPNSEQQKTPRERKRHTGGQYIAWSTSYTTDIRRLIAFVLNIDLDKETLSNEELQKRLIKAGHCVELKQINNEIERFESGAGDTAFVRDGKPTSWFVNNYDETVSIVYVYWEYREESGHELCYVLFPRFSNAVTSGGRLVSRNLRKY